MLANEAQQRSDRAKRLPVLRDTTLFKSWLPQEPNQHGTLVRSIRGAVKDSCRFRRGQPDGLGRVRWLPPRVSEHILSFLCATHPDRDQQVLCRDCSGCCPIHWGHHRDQPTVEEFCAFIAREVMTNLDLAAEARGRPKDKMPKDKSAVVDEDDAGVDRDPDAGAGDHYSFCLLYTSPSPRD